MKLFLLSILFCCSQLSAQTSIYSISMAGLNGNNITLNSYQGKKILVAAVSPEGLQNGYLNFLDSLQATNDSVVIIAIPASDFGGSQNAEILETIKNDTASHVVLTSLSLVQKDNGENQNNLMKWLTTDTENIHFNSEVFTDTQLYLINAGGILYAVLEKGVPLDVIGNLLKQ